MRLAILLILLPTATMAQQLGGSPGAASTPLADGDTSKPTLNLEKGGIQGRGGDLAHTPTEDETPSKVIKRTYCWHSDGVRYCSSSRPTNTAATVNSTLSGTAPMEVPTGGAGPSVVKGGLVVIGVIGALLV